MGSKAPHVVTDDAGIRALEALVHELQGNSHVVLRLRDGSTCEGVVTVRPSVQVFRDDEDREGINAVVQLERPDCAGLASADLAGPDSARRASRLGAGKRELNAPAAGSVALPQRAFQAGSLASTGRIRMNHTLRLGVPFVVCIGLLLAACSPQSGTPAPTAEQQKAQADATAASRNLATYRQLLKLHNDEMVVTMGKDIVSRFPDSDAAKEVQQTLPAIEKRYEANREKNRLAALWTYQVAPMAGGTQSTASIYSTRRGDGEQVRLVLRRHTSWGQSAFLYGSKPGFLCRGNCTITGKADGKPVRIKAFTPKAGSRR